MIGRTIRRALEISDSLAAAVSPGLFPEGPGLITLLIHSLYRDHAEAINGNQDPQQFVTVAHFRECIEAFLAAGYSFVGPAELNDPSPSASRRIMLTFDDGYFNNTRAVPVLEEFGVPATFFVSTGHVQQGKSFWWDAAYRHLAKAGLSETAMIARRRVWKRLRNHEIEAALLTAFGKECLRPIGDADRPMTPDELRDFSRARHVHIGNHTIDHAILPNYTPEEMRSQICGCQEALAAMTGSAPRIIAYPNGNYDPEVVKAAEAEGLTVGIGLGPFKNPASGWDARRRMALGRFILWGDRDIAKQCRVFRCGIAPGMVVRRLAKKGY